MLAILTAFTLLLRISPATAKVCAGGGNECREFKCQAGTNPTGQWATACGTALMTVGGQAATDMPLCVLAKQATGCANPLTTWHPRVTVNANNNIEEGQLAAKVGTLNPIYDYKLCVRGYQGPRHQSIFMSPSCSGADGRSTCNGSESTKAACDFCQGLWGIHTNVWPKFWPAGTVTPVAGGNDEWVCQDLIPRPGQSVSVDANFDYVLYESNPVCFCAFKVGSYTVKMSKNLCDPDLEVNCRNNGHFQWVNALEGEWHENASDSASMWPLWIFLGLAVGGGSGYAVSKYTNSPPEAPHRPDHYFSPAEDEPIKSQAAPVSQNRSRAQFELQQEQRQEESHHTEVRMLQEQRNHAPAIGVGS